MTKGKGRTRIEDVVEYKVSQHCRGDEVVGDIPAPRLTEDLAARLVEGLGKSGLCIDESASRKRYRLAEESRTVSVPLSDTFAQGELMMLALHDDRFVIQITPYASPRRSFDTATRIGGPYTVTRGLSAYFGYDGDDMNVFDTVVGTVERIIWESVPSAPGLARGGGE